MQATRDRDFNYGLGEGEMDTQARCRDFGWNKDWI